MIVRLWSLLLLLLLLPSIGFALPQLTAVEETHNFSAVSDSSLPPVSPPYPVIAFSEETYDFGTVSANRSLEHTFEFRNEGSAELQIIKVSPP